MTEDILQQFLPYADIRHIQPFGNGLINHTWKVTTTDGEEFVLQRINHAVFRQPEAIAANLRQIDRYLRQHHPGYLHIAPLQTVWGNDLVTGPGGEPFRLFQFVKDSRSIDVVSNPRQAYEGARQFALFTHTLSEYNAASLEITLPDFHNLSLHYTQFQQVLTKGDPIRLQAGREWIDYLASQKAIVDTYDSIRKDPAFTLRVTHHDTKISNILFDPDDKGLCVIDLDTVMPGYFISDVGDMMRTYLSPAAEDETDHRKIIVREDIFRAIAEGYLGVMKVHLSREETAHFVYAGKFMIYMQSLRFLTDYLRGDVYYKPAYPEHNLDRAKNQAVLLQRIIEKEETLKKIVDEALR